MKTVIVAAGMGTRLWRRTYTIPKTLLPFGDGTILSTIMDNFNKVGIDSFVIVVGYQSEYIINYMKENENLGYDVQFVQNDDWNKGNGISVLVAEEAVKEEDFILSMSDHIIPVNALRRIVEQQSERNLLLVDPQIGEIFDIDDATKVAYTGRQIVDIGKGLTEYNGIDCGIFKLTHRFFDAMRQALEGDRDSISAAIMSLITNNDMEAVFLEAQEKWIDIDTPKAYKHSLRNIDLSNGARGM
jgi:1L-myo-inositol 1-phosphate cytidylyltransferase